MNIFTFSANFTIGYTLAFVRFDIEEIIKLIGEGNLLKIAELAFKNPGGALLVLAFVVLLAVIFTNISKEKN